EPAFLDELAIIMDWAFDYMQRDGEGDPNERTWLRDETGGSVYLRLSTRPLDLFNYRVMKMFVHGDTRPGFRPMYTDTANYDLEYFFRFGTDSLNYYEYRAPVKPGWHPENEMVVRFSDITAIKLGRDSARGFSERVPVPDGPVGATFQVRGQPTVTRVSYLTIGVTNPANKGAAFYTGDLWVNELRLVDVDDTPGWAYRFESAVKFADVASVSVGMTQTDPFFHGLEQRVGSRSDSRNWSLNANIGFERFLPVDWKGSQMTLTYSHQEVLNTPRYMPGTDILVDQAVD
ncbi:MAG: hypothetical protein WD295_06710, partial [Bacteroidota bacterium]